MQKKLNDIFFCHFRKTDCSSYSNISSRNDFHFKHGELDVSVKNGTARVNGEEATTLDLKVFKLSPEKLYTIRMRNKTLDVDGTILHTTHTDDTYEEQPGIHFGDQYFTSDGHQATEEEKAEMKREGAKLKEMGRDMRRAARRTRREFRNSSSGGPNVYMGGSVFTGPNSATQIGNIQIGNMRMSGVQVNGNSADWTGMGGSWTSTPHTYNGSMPEPTLEDLQEDMSEFDEDFGPNSTLPIHEKAYKKTMKRFRNGLANLESEIARVSVKSDRTSKRDKQARSSTPNSESENTDSPRHNTPDLYSAGDTSNTIPKTSRNGLHSKSVRFSAQHSGRRKPAYTSKAETYRYSSPPDSPSAKQRYQSRPRSDPASRASRSSVATLIDWLWSSLFTRRHSHRSHTSHSAQSDSATWRFVSTYAPPLAQVITWLWPGDDTASLLSSPGDHEILDRSMRSTNTGFDQEGEGFSGSSDTGRKRQYSAGSDGKSS